MTGEPQLKYYEWRTGEEIIRDKLHPGGLGYNLRVRLAVSAILYRAMCGLPA